MRCRASEYSGWLSHMVRIMEIDPDDDAALRAFFDAEQAAIRHDRPEAVIRTWDALRTTARTPNPYYRRTFLVAVDDEGTVGACDLGGSVGDNEHLADVEINVVAHHRRRGIGRALWEEADQRRRNDGRSTVCGEVHVPTGADPATTPSHAFATSLGFGTFHLEDHLVLGLPVDHQQLGELRERVTGRATDYDVVTWGDRCPDEYAAAYCAMKTQMSNDVPVGEIDYQPIVYDEARLRTQEERLAPSYHQVIAAARRSDGVFAGYTQLLLPRDGDTVIQDDTLVMPGHRGHRLGTLLKLATLEILLRDHRQRRSIHTWTDPENHAIYRTNTEMGFRAVEQMHEMQRKDD